MRVAKTRFVRSVNSWRILSLRIVWIRKRRERRTPSVALHIDDHQSAVRGSNSNTYGPTSTVGIVTS